MTTNLNGTDRHATAPVGRAAAAAPVTRRRLLEVAAGGIGARVLGGMRWPADATSAAAPAITVYKSPSCGCCHLWIRHLEGAGFQVTPRDVGDVTPYRRKYGVPAALASCHTAVVDGYSIEGHVPADVIRKLLTEKPPVLGLAAPGMPQGSPGMEQGGPAEHFDIISFTRSGKTAVYASR
jgi:hypothetical protein